MCARVVIEREKDWDTIWQNIYSERVQYIDNQNVLFMPCICTETMLMQDACILPFFLRKTFFREIFFIDLVENAISCVCVCNDWKLGRCVWCQWLLLRDFHFPLYDVRNSIFFIVFEVDSTILIESELNNWLYRVDGWIDACYFLSGCHCSCGFWNLKF